MSPPTRAPEHEVRRAPAPDSEAATHAKPPGGTGTRSGEQVVLAAQRSAGNQAVAKALGGPGGVQRAPNEGEQVVSRGATTAVGDDDDMPAPVVNKGSVTAVGDDDDRPAPVQNKGAVTAVGDSDDKPAPVRKQPLAPGGQGGQGAQGVIGPGMAGGVPKVVERMWFRAKPVDEDEALVAFHRDPSSVVRSPDRYWHWQMWNKSEGASRHGMRAPMVMRAGSLYVVHPNYQGPATVLPDYRGQGVGMGMPGSGGGGTTGSQGPTPVPGAKLLQDPSQTRLRQAVSPETPPSGPRGSIQAQKATYQEVAAAFAKNPGAVVRSPNVDWHRQGYKLDGGDGSAPFAYKVGDLYIIAPTHPLQGVPKLGESLPPKPSALPQAAQVVGLPGTDYDEKTRGRRFSASLSKSGDRTEIRDERRELTPVSGQRVTGHEIQEGDIKKRTETKVGGGFGWGGNLLGGGASRTETTKAGDDLSATRTSNVGGGLTKEGNFALTAGRQQETIVGKTPAGDPLKRSTSTTGGATIDPTAGTLGVNTAHKVTGPSGTAKTMSGGAVFDDKGSATFTGGGGLESKGGTSITTSLSAGTQVVADEPVELPDGQVEVSYRITDTVGGSVGGGQRMGRTGAPTIGGSFGRSEGDFKGGVKRFANKKEADAWRRDAGARIRGEQQIASFVPPTTVAGALMIPVGETRSSGDVSTSTMGLSGSYGGTTVGVSKSESDTHQLAIRRVSANTVEVTGAVVGTKTKGASISVPVFSNTKSAVKSASFAITWSFDLATPIGQQAFERYCRSGIPIPGGTFRSMDKGGSDEDRDDYKIPFVGTASWSGTTWEASREDASGNVQKQFGGKQSHQVKLGLLGKITGDEERSSNAQIVRSSENFEDKGGRAEFKVAGESGSFNREEFGKIFSDKGRGGGGKASGEWTLSAEVPMERIRALEEVHPKLRNALNIDEKMKIYSELVKEGGARMLGGQVGMTSNAWDLHLKGDANFPGAAERTRLNGLKASLTERLKTTPGDAYTIAREAKETLDKLEKRLSADAGISDPKKYTDLPDGLRQQQIELVKQHIRDFTQVRQRALGAGIRGGRAEKLEDIQKRATAKQGYDKVQLVDLELAKLQDSIAIKEKQIAQAFVDVRNQSRALGRVVSRDGGISIRTLYTDEERSDYRDAQSSTMIRVNLAFALDPKQDALKTQIQGMREAMDKTTDPAARLEALKPIDKAMGERLAVLREIVNNVQAAGAIVAPFASPKAMAIAPKFWTSVGGAPAEE